MLREPEQLKNCQCAKHMAKNQSVGYKQVKKEKSRVVSLAMVEGLFF